jgi:hypothetical protein
VWLVCLCCCVCALVLSYIHSGDLLMTLAIVLGASREQTAAILAFQRPAQTFAV